MKSCSKLGIHREVLLYVGAYLKVVPHAWHIFGRILPGVAPNRMSVPMLGIHLKVLLHAWHPTWTTAPSLSSISSIVKFCSILGARLHPRHQSWSRLYAWQPSWIHISSMVPIMKFWSKLGTHHNVVLLDCYAPRSRALSISSFMKPCFILSTYHEVLLHVDTHCDVLLNVCHQSWRSISDYM